MIQNDDDFDDSFLKNPRLAEYYSVKPFSFHKVVRLEICQETEEEEDYEISLEMELRHADPKDRRRLFLTFRGISDLKLRILPATELYMTQLEIRSVDIQQWQGFSYIVQEVEDEIISFYCYDFTVRVG